MKITATDRDARRVQIKAIRSNLDALNNAYAANDTPAETVSAFVDLLGYAAVDSVAELVNTVGTWDRRISDGSRAWAASVETAATPEQLEAARIYSPGIHSAHVEQIAEAMRNYQPAKK